MTLQANRQAYSTSLFNKLWRELLIADQHIWSTELKRMDGDCSDRRSKVEAYGKPKDVSTSK